MGWPLTTAGTTNPSDPIKVEAIVARLISSADHLSNVGPLPLLITLVGGPWPQFDQSARWTYRLSKIRPTTFLGAPAVHSYRKALERLFCATFRATVIGLFSATFSVT